MLINRTQDLILAKDVYQANRFWSKLKGLQFKKDIPSSFAYILFNCNSIHTCFMRFNIDVAFVNKDWKVVYLYKNLRPFRFTPIVKDAYAAIEMKAGNLEVDVGDKLNLDISIR